MISFLWVSISSGQKQFGQMKAATVKKLVQTEKAVARQTGEAQKSYSPEITAAHPSGFNTRSMNGGKASTAWLTPWNFTQSSGTYSAISGTTIGTTANDEEVFGPFNIGFNFSYNGTTYTQFSVSTNGFIGLGGTVVTTSSLPLSSGASNNVISALGLDLQGQTGSSIQYLLTGASPNQTMVIQWTNYRKKSATGDVFNFQIRLNQNGSSIVVVYNGFTVNGTNSTPQVGIRGASAADFNNRSVAAAQTWATSIAGTANTSNCFLRTAKYPANGQTYTWTPVICNNINTFPYSEDFSATLNPCWSIAQVSGTGLWTMATSINYPDLVPVVTLNPQSGTHLAKFDSYNYASGTVSRLKTATFDFTSLSSPSVEFYMAQDGQYTNLDMIEIQASTNGGTSWTTLSPAYYRFDATFTTPGWKKYTAYLPAYANTNNVTLAFLATSLYGNMMAIDNVVVKQGITDDVGTAGIWAPTKLPVGQNYPWFSIIKNYGPNTETFDVDTKLRVNGAPTLTTTNTITGLAFNNTSTLTGSFNLSSYGAGSSFDIQNETKLLTDQNTANDILTNSARACVKDTIYAWDDGVAESAVGYNTGTGWLGQMYYLSAQDTLTSISVNWGTLPGAIAGTSLEIYNVAGGLPTTKFGDIVTGISLTTADEGIWKTYAPSTPIVLPAGTYWIGVHQSVAFAGTYILSYDDSGLTAENYLSGFAFYSADAVTWNDYYASSLYSINLLRPNFANVVTPFTANPTNLTATPVSDSQINLGWALNGNGNNVLVAWNSTNSFGIPVDGTTYSTGNSIPGGGMVLQYNNATFFNHTGLSGNQTYFYKIWSYNGTLYSSGAAINATTFCSATNVPYLDNLDSYTAPSTGCLNVQDVNADNEEWFTYNGAGYPYSGANCLAIAYSVPGVTMDDWVFSQGLNLVAGQSYDVSFYYRSAATATYSERLEVKWGTAANAAAMTSSSIFNMVDFIQGTYVQGTGTFTPSTTGVYYIGWHCYSQPDMAGILLDDLSVIATPTCASPTSLNATNISQNSAILTWLAGGTESSWEYVYGVNPLATPTGSGTAVGTTSVSISGLNANQSYQFYVRAMCGGALGESPWAGPFTFQTLCNSVNTFPFSENFTAGIVPPTCWSEVITNATYNWAISATTDYAQVEYDPAPAAQDEWLVTPTLDFSALSHPRLSFSWLMSYYWGVDPYNNYDLNCKISIDNGVNWTLIWSEAGEGVFTNFTWTPEVIDLLAYSGKSSVLIAWQYSGNDGAQAGIDDILIDEWPACVSPSSLTATNITETSATLGWTAGGTETNWEYVYGLYPLTAPAGSGTSTSVNPVTISGLTAANTYQFYVRAMCGGSAGASTWSGPFTFSTLCPAYALPFNEEFEASSPTLACWYSYDLDAAGNSWSISNGTNHTTGGTYSAVHDYNSTVNENGWLISPALQIPATGITGLSFWSFNDFPTYYFKNSVLISEGSPDPGDLEFVEIWSPESVLAEWEQTQLDITAYAGKTIYIAFHYEGLDAHSWYVDDVSVTNTLPVLTFNVDMSTADGFVPGSDVVYLAGNFPGATWNEPGTNPALLMSQVGSTLTYTLSLPLPAGTYEYKYFKNAGWSNGEWSGGPNRSVTITGTTSVNDTWGGSINWANLQWPGNGTINTGDPFDVYAQVNILNGLTSAPGQAYGITAWIGYSTDNTNPSTWTNWIPAPFFGQSNDNDEYKLDLGSAITTSGTYYYASRFQYGSMPFVYGGFNGGFWDGVTNVSGVLNVNAPTTKTLNIKLFLEGLYAGSGTMNQANGLSGAEFGAGIADQVSIELHDALTPFAVAYTYSNIDLLTDGTLSITSIPGSISGDYYIVVKHRSSIETWSATPVDFSSASPLSYDFSIAATQAYGDNMKLSGSVYVIWGGDATQDGIVDGSDMAAIDNASTATLQGYNPEDVNGDGIVDGSDMAMIDNNSTATVQVMKP
jgi:hypothetical protein